MIFRLILIFPALFIFKNAEGANILAAFPAPGYSHFKPFEPLFLKLRDRGHNLTVISEYQIKEKLENYTVIMPNPRPLGGKYVKMFKNVF